MAGWTDVFTDTIRHRVLIQGFFFVGGEGGDFEAMAATVGTPTARRIPGEVLRVDLGVGFAGGGIAARGGEEGNLLAAFIDEEAGAFASQECRAHERA